MGRERLGGVAGQQQPPAPPRRRDALLHQVGRDGEELRLDVTTEIPRGDLAQVRLVHGLVERQGADAEAPEVAVERRDHPRDLGVEDEHQDGRRQPESLEGVRRQPEDHVEHPADGLGLDLADARGAAHHAAPAVASHHPPGPHALGGASADGHGGHRDAGGVLLHRDDLPTTRDRGTEFDRPVTQHAVHVVLGQVERRFGRQGVPVGRRRPRRTVGVQRLAEVDPADATADDPPAVPLLRKRATGAQSIGNTPRPREFEGPHRDVPGPHVGGLDLGAPLYDEGRDAPAGELDRQGGPDGATADHHHARRRRQAGRDLRVVHRGRGRDIGQCPRIAHVGRGRSIDERDPGPTVPAALRHPPSVRE